MRTLAGANTSMPLFAMLDTTQFSMFTFAAASTEMPVEAETTEGTAAGVETHFPAHRLAKCLFELGRDHLTCAASTAA